MNVRRNCKWLHFEDAFDGDRDGADEALLERVNCGAWRLWKTIVTVLRM